MRRFFSRTNFTWRRIKLGLDHNKFGKLIADIDRDIEQIEKLVEGNLELSPLRQKQRKVGNSKFWLNIRNRAKGLFEAINSRWACSCIDYHHASLQLEALRDLENNSDEVSFRVLFYFDQLPGRPPFPIPWNWREVVITQFETQTAQSV